MSEEKIPLKVVKKMPYKSLNRMIGKAKKYIKSNEVWQKICKEYDEDADIIDYIPMMFGDLDVSAKCDHGIVILNYKLLCDGDFVKDFSYLIHECTHWFQQCYSNKATRSSDDGNYLKNPYEQEGFANQVEYINDQFGKQEAVQYVDDLLEHHDVEDKKEKKELKETLMSKV
jgi:hypothetical protein